MLSFGNSRRRIISSASLLLVILLVSACQENPGRQLMIADPSQAPFLPPTPVASTPSPSPAPLEQENPYPTATPQCEPDLTFKEDLSVPDGTTASPGEKLDKRWLVENSGSCNWDKNYRIRLIAGPSLGAVTEQALYPARSGADAILRIEFTAPTALGFYRSAWQAHNPAGGPFGHIFFVDFVVADE
jgi:hypothetical protein